MEELTLVIMAAGMGSRFGGLKQIEPVGPNGEFIIDYSIYDAIRAGFNKVVFIIKEENYDLFKETIEKRIPQNIKIEYAFQKLENIPLNIIIPKTRTKPWGTAHAILSAKDKVNGNFAVINADDFYGRETYDIMANFLRNSNQKNEYLIIGYKIKNTLSENGKAKRGICSINNGYLESIIECNVEKNNGVIIAQPLNNNNTFTVNDNTFTSMNAFGFTTELFIQLERDMKLFLENNKKNLEKCEALIPEFINNYIQSKEIIAKIIPTNSKWQGITYREDKESVINEIRELINNGEYPNNLTNKE